MVEEHAKQQMIERVLTRMIEIADEGPLAKVGRWRNASIRRMGIELFGYLYQPLSVLHLG